jgi:hypothetical protein
LILNDITVAEVHSRIGKAVAAELLPHRQFVNHLKPLHNSSLEAVKSFLAKAKEEEVRKTYPGDSRSFFRSAERPQSSRLSCPQRMYSRSILRERQFFTLIRPEASLWASDYTPGDCLRVDTVDMNRVSANIALMYMVPNHRGHRRTLPYDADHGLM